MTKTAEIGTISRCTAKAEDLIPAFLEVLEECSKTDDDREWWKKLMIHKTLNHWFGNPWEAFAIGRPDEIEDFVNYLMDSLNDISPPGCYFGAHPGNGTDYGFWPDEDYMDEMEGLGELVRLPAGDEWPETFEPQAELVLEVTDHGNMTLYDLNHNEIWSVV